MGLSASQARLLLLTAKNDGLELEAQMISNERLLLSQEQETIADEYSDATSNMIYECSTSTVEASKDNGTTGTVKKGMSLKTFAQANCGAKASNAKVYKVQKDGYKDKDGKEYKKGDEIEYSKIVREADGTYDESSVVKEEGAAESWSNKVAFSYGGYTYFAQAQFDMAAQNDSEAYTMQYWRMDSAGNIEEITEGDDILTSLNNSGPDGIFQRSMRNGTGELYIQTGQDQDLETSSFKIANFDKNAEDGSGKIGFVRKSADSLASTSSRYYTEDDAAAQAEYNTAMNRVNAMDKKLENKLNQIETQKKAVETEMESAEQLIKTNVERTFKYFG